MFDVSGRATAIRRSVVAGAAALTLGGLTASAQAFPAAPAVSTPSGVESVQYDGDGHRMRAMHRHHRNRHRLGENYHPHHPGYAGQYDCGPGGKATRLSRRACGGNDRFAHLKRDGHYD